MLKILVAAGAGIAALPALFMGQTPAHQDKPVRSAGGVINNARERMDFRDERNVDVELDPHALVRVAGIAGSVTVVTGAGNIASVHVVRMAPTQHDLDCYATSVSAEHDGIGIEHVQHSDRPGCASIHARQEVRLTLPRAVDIAMENIGGTADIDPILGKLHLRSIGQLVTARGVRSADLASLGQGASLTVGAVDPSGIRVASVAGILRIAFARGANADISVSSVTGPVASTSTVPLVENDGRYAGRVGTGGPRVTLSSIAGEVRLTHD